MKHPLRGTCFPGCRLFGFCHCGCGERTAIAKWNNATEGLVKGMPMIHVNHHKANKGRLTRNGMPVAYVRDELELALKLVGTQTALAKMLGHTDGWLSMIRKGKQHRITVADAMRISEIARGGTRSTLPNPRNPNEAEAQRQYRKLGKAPPCPGCGGRMLRSSTWTTCAYCRGEARKRRRASA